jgi:hypothetical protein
MSSPGEAVRETYRRQGRDEVKTKIIFNLSDDAVLSLLLPTSVLERIVEIVENTK